MFCARVCGQYDVPMAMLVMPQRSRLQVPASNNGRSLQSLAVFSLHEGDGGSNDRDAGEDEGRDMKATLSG